MFRLPLLAGALAVLSSTSAFAIPIDSDLTIAGSVEFSTSDSATVNNATGTIYTPSSSSSISGASISGTNPQELTLTETGQGLGHTLSMSGDGRVTNSINDDLFIDYLFSISNNSADTFELTFAIDFANTVDSNGADAFSDSEFVIQDESLNELFFTDLISDTAFGDSIDGNETGSFGNLQSASGTDYFTLTLAGNSALSFSGMLSASGAVFDSGDYALSMDSFVYLSDVKNTTSPVPVSEPGSFVLMLVGLGLLCRRSKHYS